MDTTGAQYGYPDPLCSWPGFEQRRLSKVIDNGVLGTMRREAYLSKAIVPMRHVVAEMTEKQELTEAIEEMVPALAQACGGKLSVMVTGSDAAFERAKDVFLDQVEHRLRETITKMYAPDQIAKRNKGIDSQIAQNMGNPVGRKIWVDMMRHMASTVETPKGRVSEDVWSSQEGYEGHHF